MVIPNRFVVKVDAHMLGNMLDIPHYPLILAIVGRPGMGKTYQLRNYLKEVDVSVFQSVLPTSKAIELENRLNYCSKSTLRHLLQCLRAFLLC